MLMWIWNARTARTPKPAGREVACSRSGTNQTLAMVIDRNVTERERTMSEGLIDRITQYLYVGGVFNPELMEHDKVRDLLIDCCKELSRMEAVKRELLAMVEGMEHDPTNLGWKHIR